MIWIAFLLFFCSDIALGWVVQRHGAWNLASSPLRFRAFAAQCDSLQASKDNENDADRLITKGRRINKEAFDLSLALLCSGLAFDAYVEPSEGSSRWERGSSGVNVAFCSVPFTRSIYQGLIELTVRKITHLPSTSENDSTAERMVSGDGIDAYVLAAIIEGQWTDDIQTIENQQFFNGILDLTGAAHVSRTSTCWSSVTKDKALASFRKNGVLLPYHVPAPSIFDLIGKKEENIGAQAIWHEDKISTEPPIYLYVQDPANARLTLSVMDDDRISLTSKIDSATSITGQPIGSSCKKLKELIPQAGWTQATFIQEMKRRVVHDIQKNGADLANLDDTVQRKMKEIESTHFLWEGSLPLTSKPRRKDKGGQMWLSAAAGAAIAGPIGAATGAVLANLYESPISGQIHCRVKYTPLPPPIGDDSVSPKAKRNTYIVKGGMPGIDWGTLYSKYQQKFVSSEQKLASGDFATRSNDDIILSLLNSINMYSDLEHCFFVSHRKTGATCAVYRSIRYKFVVVSFRGTCAPIDLITDASLIQETWVQGEDADNQSLSKVHVGFRTSMNSIARRLKELILAIPAPGEKIDQYDMFVTGHSLGGALATLFTADIGQYGIDAGRGLPQLEESEPWWKAVVNSFLSVPGSSDAPSNEPPRPKSLRLYNFGSPRVGNLPFAELFDALCDEGYINQAYRIVNGEDVVARLPRTFNAMIFGNINYEHVGTTVLLTHPDLNSVNNTDDPVTVESTISSMPCIWIEGESDDKQCPVRDGVRLTSPLAEGTLLNDLFTFTRESFASGGALELNDASKGSVLDRISSVVVKVADRMKNLKATDLGTILGIDQSYTDRELRLIQSLVQGKALAHHLEDEYYAGMGRASGFVAQVNKEIVETLGPFSSRPS
jgi:Lipase (class 3)